MQNVESVHTPMRLRDRLSTRLALLFAASFLGSLLVIGAWSLMSMISERNQAAEQVNVQAPAIVIDPKIGAELTRALAFDAIPAATQVQNPFVDRAGLAGRLASTTATANRPGSSTTSVAASGSGSKPPGSTEGSSTGAVFSNPSGGAEIVYVDQGSATKSRYDEWLARQKRGEFVPPVSEILAVEDLVPVGYATGGDRAPEVMLMSLSLCRTFSFPAATRFYDGVLNGFDQREVVFIFGNGVRRKSYLDGNGCEANAASRSTGTSN
jgi:hypothetical protein